MSSINELVSIHVMDLPRDKFFAQIAYNVEIFKQRHPHIKRVHSSPSHWPLEYDKDDLFSLMKFHNGESNCIDGRMKELGLIDSYMRALIDIVAPNEDQINVAWKLLHVTNYQRCLAALKVMGIEYE